MVESLDVGLFDLFLLVLVVVEVDLGVSELHLDGCEDLVDYPLHKLLLMICGVLVGTGGRAAALSRGGGPLDGVAEVLDVGALAELARGLHEGLLEVALPLQGGADVLEHLQDLYLLSRPQVEIVPHQQAELESIRLDL